MNAKQYEAYQQAVERGLKGLEGVSTGAIPGCPECGLEKDCTENQREAANEAGFSWSECDVCGSTLGGDRYPAHGWMKQREGWVVDGNCRTYTRHDLLIHLDVCADCLYYINYGQLDDTTMMEIEDSKK